MSTPNTNQQLINPTTGKPYTMQELVDRVQTLEAAKNNGPAKSFKISEEKGGISAYGFGKFPVTMYASGWEEAIKLMTGKPLAADSPLGLFIEKNKPLLAFKSDSPEQSAAKLLLRKASLTGVVSHPKNNGVAA